MTASDNLMMVKKYTDFHSIHDYVDHLNVESSGLAQVTRHASAVMRHHFVTRPLREFFRVYHSAVPGEDKMERMLTAYFSALFVLMTISKQWEQQISSTTATEMRSELERSEQ